MKFTPQGDSQIKKGDRGVGGGRLSRHLLEVKRAGLVTLRVFSQKRSTARALLCGTFEG